ncbi:unnamed protein product [Effrenium voratum]|nr:unnamed protein product [Effrenium voratum]
MPSRATTARMWIGLAALHLTKGATDFAVLLPAMAVKVSQGQNVHVAVILCTLAHGVYGIGMGVLLTSGNFRRWTHFQLISASGSFTAAAGIAAFLGNRSKALGAGEEKVMELAQQACRYISGDQLTWEDMAGPEEGSEPNSKLQALSTSCSLQENPSDCFVFGFVYSDIDAFLSHSWHDAAESKWEAGRGAVETLQEKAALQAWRRAFKARSMRSDVRENTARPSKRSDDAQIPEKSGGANLDGDVVQHQREPRLWIDKYCIDQTDIEASLMCLPVFLACCHTLLIIAGSTYFERLWCVEEVFVYLQMRRSVNSIELLPISDDMEERVNRFDVQAAQCVLNSDRQKLLATIEAGCENYRAFNQQVQHAFQVALKRAKWPLTV